MTDEKKKKHYTFFEPIKEKPTPPPQQSSDSESDREGKGLSESDGSSKKIIDTDLKKAKKSRGRPKLLETIKDEVAKEELYVKEHLAIWSDVGLKRYLIRQAYREMTHRD